MRLAKSLLCGISALVLATGTAFAGQDSSMQSSVENSSPELLGGPEWMANESFGSERFGSSLDDGDRQYFVSPESEVIYLYPIEVTEYYLIIPSQSSEMPG
jgi:hypothetical protein